MKALKYGFGLILVGGFALTASCGGSSDDSSSPSGGTSSSTGGTSSATAGAVATGGSATGAGNTTGNPTGGTDGTTGGSVGTTGGTLGTAGGRAGATGGRAGTTGGAGGGPAMNPAGCPATAPAIPARGMPRETCTPLANRRDVCNYVVGTTTETCTCNVAFMGPGGGEAGAAAAEGTLQCVTRTTPIACPAMPMTGDACSGPCRVPGGRRMCACTKDALVCPEVMGAAGAPG